MKTDVRIWLNFIVWMILTDIISAFVAINFLGYAFSSPEWKWALLVADINAVGGFWLSLRSTGKSINAVYASVMGAMLGRMIGLGIVLWFALVKAGFSKIGFTITLFVAYICKSVAEMVLLKLSSRK